MTNDECRANRPRKQRFLSEPLLERSDDEFEAEADSQQNTKRLSSKTSRERNIDKAELLLRLKDAHNNNNNGKTAAFPLTPTSAADGGERERERERDKEMVSRCLDLIRLFVCSFDWSFLAGLHYDWRCFGFRHAIWDMPCEKRRWHARGLVSHWVRGDTETEARRGEASWCLGRRFARSR